MTDAGLQSVGDDLDAALSNNVPDPIDWVDAENALETGTDVLRALAGDGPLIAQVVAAIDEQRILPQKGERGACWYPLARSEELDAALWLRFCPSGSVVAAHQHDRPFVARVLHGMYKQVVLGIGGGVASSTTEIPLYVRHEQAGQTFALSPRQRHASSSSVGLLLMVLTPYAPPHPDPQLAGSPGSIARKLRNAIESPA